MRLMAIRARIDALAKDHKKSTITTKLSEGKLLVTAELPSQSFYSSVRTDIMRAATGSHSKLKLSIREQLRENELSLMLTV